jgi:hypothetical protein
MNDRTDGLTQMPLPGFGIESPAPLVSIRARPRSAPRDPARPNDEATAKALAAIFGDAPIPTPGPKAPLLELPGPAGPGHSVYCTYGLWCSYAEAKAKRREGWWSEVKRWQAGQWQPWFAELGTSGSEAQHRARAAVKRRLEANELPWVSEASPELTTILREKTYTD